MFGFQRQYKVCFGLKLLFLEFLATGARDDDVVTISGAVCGIRYCSDHDSQRSGRFV